ncbi:MAG: hypothetical protein COB15_00245 [Flavobacteriales bacterium]|nr:MAG: hypothetical protein COB15_00245 [Flavobacteriales bacterium]
MRCITFYLLVCSLLFTTFCKAQHSFTRNDNLTILSINGDTLKNPWAGGFNAVQFSEIDLNLDGINDLFVFDRTGNRISTFINSGEANQITYTHDPSYIQYFPTGLRDWVLLRDYNCDGKMDIFTSSSGGIGAYKNTSTSQLSFVLDTNQIHSDVQPDSLTPSYTNIFISTANLPAFDDIDNDGDLDILTLSIIGGRIEYHKNLSMERNGDCSQLDFQLRNKCWGFIKENPGQNKAIFYDTCFVNVGNPEKTATNDKHVGGSSFLTLDIDGNNNKDLLLGGNSYKNLLLLINDDLSPNLTSSSITTQDFNFPLNNLSTTKLDIQHFVAGFYTDVNNDGVKDLICSTNSPSYSENTNNVWLYQNDNLTNNPDFNLKTKAFLQDGMIELGQGSHPTFFDYNADGLLDIIIGNYGLYDENIAEYYVSSLWLYENKGTAINPYYQLVDSNYVNISNLTLDLQNNRKTLGLHPTFGDLDGDGDQDMIVGDYIGYMHYFENTAGAGNPANFVLNQAQYNNIDIGGTATPQLIDLNRDSKLDLVIGTEAGFFTYYENTGTVNSPAFTLITTSLGNINTKRSTDFQGNSSPFIYDEGGNYKMLSGSSNGYLYKFENIDGNLTGTFSIDSTFLGIWEGVQSNVGLADINNDTYLDLLVGNLSGGVAYFQGYDATNIESINNKIDEIHVYPNPTSNQIHINLGNNNLSNSSIEIVNLLGKVVFAQSVKNNSIIVNLQSYYKGIYLLKFNNNDGSKVIKIVKE